jgi:multiple sugar transport system permease protein
MAVLLAQRSQGWRRAYILLRKLVSKVAFGALILLLMALTLFVFFWMVSMSLKNPLDNASYPPVFWPRELQFDNYVEVFRKNPFGRYALNSVIVAVGSTGLSLLLGAPAAYGVAKWKHHRVALAVLVARLVPGLSFLIPWFILFRNLGMSDSHLTLILTHMVVGMPLVVWIMIGFFEDLPPEIDDAARVDGCSPFGSFSRIALPLALPGLVVSGILAFIASWNNFMFSVVLGGPYTRTLPVAVFNMMSYEQTNWGPLAAAALIVTLPVLVLAMFTQRYIVAGLAAGGVKG